VNSAADVSKLAPKNLKCHFLSILLLNPGTGCYGLLPLDLLKSLGITQDFPINDDAQVESTEEQEEGLV